MRAQKCVCIECTFVCLLLCTDFCVRVRWLCVAMLALKTEF